MSKHLARGSTLFSKTVLNLHGCYTLFIYLFILFFVYFTPNIPINAKNYFYVDMEIQQQFSIYVFQVSENDSPIHEQPPNPITNPGDQTEASEFSRPATLPSAKRKKTQQQADDNLLESAMAILKTTSDKLNTTPENCEVKSFCNFLCSKMLNYSPARRQGVQHSIYEILMKADRGYFDNPYGPSQFLSRSAPFSSYGHHTTSNIHQPSSSVPYFNSYEKGIPQPHVSQHNHDISFRSDEYVNPTNQVTQPDVSSQRGGGIHTPHDFGCTSSPSPSQFSESDSMYDYV